MEREELAAWLRLAWAPGLGRTTARRLLAAFGLPQAVFAQDTTAIEQATSAAVPPLLRERPAGLDALTNATLDWLAQAPAGQSRRVLTLADPLYPASLLQTEDPPLVLYAAGQPVDAWPRAIAIVGSRNPTAQGRIDAREFARSFARSGLTVVSGLALGIDGAAHEGALDGAADGQLATIAIVGTGLDRVYPQQHHDLAHRIASRGLLLSEYPVGTPPLSDNFPQRNRIISGLASGTLVVEAAVRSGSLITARLAAEQGKDVYAIPGSIHSPQSRGCHALLKQGAKLVETAEDVLEDMEAPVRAPTRPTPREDVPLLQAMGHAPLSLDALVARTGTSAADLQAQLLELELQGRVARLAGGLFQRLERA
ncbi:DNA-processing protein DprA [Ramlibacter algicola]|uniref:DNA-protecting protein DprA n=1 Tax=Ramlibacter algicola TaxID=2795217 RepID=A0A934UQ33_9BURK|nr:DNA-processing protein DprA [Ramlibacter algicola]MBK0391238.1 DNA-protecting protein DprA [Ramlibacter algicola]